METLRETGNEALHPRPGETVTRYPKVLRKRALDCVCAVQDVLEDLYA